MMKMLLFTRMFVEGCSNANQDQQQLLDYCNDGRRVVFNACDQGKALHSCEMLHYVTQCNAMLPNVTSKMLAADWWM